MRVCSASDMVIWSILRLPSGSCTFGIFHGWRWLIQYARSESATWVTGFHGRIIGLLAGFYRACRLLIGPWLFLGCQLNVLERLRFFVGFPFLRYVLMSSLNSWNINCISILWPRIYVQLLFSCSVWVVFIYSPSDLSCHISRIVVSTAQGRRAYCWGWPTDGVERCRVGPWVDARGWVKDRRGICGAGAIHRTVGSGMGALANWGGWCIRRCQCTARGRWRSIRGGAREQGRVEIWRTNGKAAEAGGIFGPIKVLWSTGAGGT